MPQARGWEKKIADGPPCVVLASPGFMQVGPSRELFELWAPDARNGLIITGYSIEGTLAKVSSAIQGHSACLSCVKYSVLQWTYFLHLTLSKSGYEACKLKLIPIYGFLGYHDRARRVHFT